MLTTRKLRNLFLDALVITKSILWMMFIITIIVLITMDYSIKKNLINYLFEACTHDFFVVDNISVSENNHAYQERLDSIVSNIKSKPMFSFDLDNVRQEIEYIDLVDKAYVRRIFPNKIDIKITEYKPFAIWQNDGNLQLISKEGVVIGQDISEFLHLPFIVGREANNYVTDLFSIIDKFDIVKSVKSAIFVNERRWNLRMNNGTEIKLPESGLQESLKQLSNKFTKEQILSGEFEYIDMKVHKRIYVKRKQIEQG